MRVLIADDEPISRKLIAAAAQSRQHEVVFASDGETAWQILQTPDAPQLAVLDWMMPGLSGIDLCRRIRGANSPRYTYVLLVTSKTEGDDLIAGLESGADDYVTKPFSRRELEARLVVGQRILDLEARLVGVQEELKFLVSHDSLTGAWNRHAALTRFAAEMARARREKASLGICLIDLDHFKTVNDMHGHAAGDAVLKEVVRRWGFALRPFDVLARYGGEEFLVLLPGCALSALPKTAERLRRSIGAEALSLSGQGPLLITCSIGGTVYTAVMQATPEQLVSLADQALYRAKRLGRDRVEITDYETGAELRPSLPSLR
jgi:two-component system cell cycle response regulator